MAALDSSIVKSYGMEAGASVVGIVSAKDLDDAPQGYRPSDALEGCVSVVILAIPFSRDAYDNEYRYTEVRSDVINRSTAAAKEVAKRIKGHKFTVKAIAGMSGKPVDGITWGTISLKHAAEAAGLGVIGKNYLLINPEYGTLLWFSAVLTDAELEPDPKKQYDLCSGCSLCVDSCPTGALRDITNFGKKGCAKHSFKFVGGKWMMDCFKCRAVCPHSLGF
jgi:epoxyqueuosine reductase QueG